MHIERPNLYSALQRCTSNVLTFIQLYKDALGFTKMHSASQSWTGAITTCTRAVQQCKIRNKNFKPRVKVYTAEVQACTPRIQTCIIELKSEIIFFINKKPR